MNSFKNKILFLFIFLFKSMEQNTIKVIMKSQRKPNICPASLELCIWIPVKSFGYISLKNS